MDRLREVRRQMAARRTGALLVTNPMSLKYLFRISDLRWALVTPRQVYVVPFRLGEDVARKQLRRTCILLASSASWEIIPRLLARFPPYRLAFEESSMTVSLFRSISRVIEHQLLLVAGGPIVESSREVKFADEITMIEKASRITRDTLAQLEIFVSPGMTERSIAVFVDRTMRQLGADGPAFETIVLGGPRSAYPHGVSSERRIKAGELLLIDVGARVAGYCSDMTRVYALSRSTARQKAIYARVFRSYLAGVRALGRGRPAGKAYDASRKALGGLAHRFIHGLGHGVGLEIHESPRLASMEVQKLRSGNVVTVEPGVYFPGWGGIRLEDTYLIRGNRAISVTGMPAPALPVLGRDLKGE